MSRNPRLKGFAARQPAGAQRGVTASTMRRLLDTDANFLWGFASRGSGRTHDPRHEFLAVDGGKVLATNQLIGALPA